jgi:2-polyprenyl-6-methoxyphenol hydroxylase-like FAD-dependent oxidoreductase
LAFWLSRFGYDVTIVEKAPSLRAGGYAVDFRGTSMEALRRMGLLENVQALGTHMGDMFYVNSRGKPTVRMPSAAFSGELEIMRGDLAQIFHDATRADTRYIFGDSIAKIHDHGDAVTVTFESGDVRDYGLVVGADGVHSNVRAKVFGDERQFVRDLNMCVSIFTVPNRLGLDYSGRLFSAPGTVAGVYSARHNTEARAMFYFKATAQEMACREPAQQKAIVRRAFAGQGWVVPQLLADMDIAPEVYFDSISQIELEHWSKGRVVLLGDAASCASPLSGMGTGIAVVGAYVLAHELAAAQSHTEAFARYQQVLTPFVQKSQKFARDAAKSGFAPDTRLGILMRDLVMRVVIPRLPVEVMLKEVRAAANAVSLKDYALQGA